jgi:hypothetical protein
MGYDLGQWKQWTRKWQDLRKVVMRSEEEIKKTKPNLHQWEWRA